MEEQGCCLRCYLADPPQFVVPLSWHPEGETAAQEERLCTVCFARLFPGETMMSFDLGVLPKWTEEGFAPSHVMLLRAKKKLLVLVSHLDAHHVEQFRRFAAAAHEEVDDELLRQMARDYRGTKDAIANMATRAWWDQMRIWPQLLRRSENKK